MESLKHYLSMASLAVKATRAALHRGASNRPEMWEKYGLYDPRSATSGLSMYLCVIRARKNVPSKFTIAALRQMARQADEQDCGNCGENAAFAYIYLYNKGVRPICMVNRGDTDHAFVVLGQQPVWIEHDYTTWGDSCVVCDPWDDSFYEASKVPTRMYGYAGEKTRIENIHEIRDIR
jgi:hypothetical protein